jgi:hypothetical protein
MPDSFRIFPNPNDGNMTLEYNIENVDAGELLIYDVTGSFIESLALDGNKDRLDISDNRLHNGIYFYSIIVNNVLRTKGKFVVIKP